MDSWQAALPDQGVLLGGRSGRHRRFLGLEVAEVDGFDGGEICGGFPGPGRFVAGVAGQRDLGLRRLEGDVTGLGLLEVVVLEMPKAQVEVPQRYFR